MVLIIYQAVTFNQIISKKEMNLTKLLSKKRWSVLLSGEVKLAEKIQQPALSSSPFVVSGQPRVACSKDNGAIPMDDGALT